MYFKSNSLCKILNDYKKIIIYGTGKFAQEIYPHLVECGLKEKIVCFTQTEEPRINFIDGIEVCQFEKISCDKTEYIVLIAASKLYEDEIKKELITHKFLKIISLTDFIWDCKQSERILREKASFDEYCECIAEWYVETQAYNLDKRIVTEGLINRRKNIKEKIDSNLIVMICGNFSPRTIKIIGALKRKKYNIVLLAYAYNNPWYLDEIEKLNVDICKCQCIEEMLYNSLQYYPKVYFFEPRWGDCSWAEIMLKNKSYFGKVVLAEYDILNDGYAGQNEDDLKTEKFALEYADGIVWRWFSKNYLEEKGFKYQGKSIQFIDYCNHDMKDKDEYRDGPAVMKLCDLAGWGDEYVEERQSDERYTDLARIGEILARIGNRRDCIFHFYAGSLSSKIVEVCKQYKKQYRNFDFFCGTKYSDLLRRLKNYDYLCELYTNGKEPANDTILGGRYGSIYRHAIRNVFFDCLYAGVPIITTSASKLWEYLSDYDVVIKMDLENLDIEYLKRYRKYYKSQARAAGQALDIDKHIQRLIQFFNEL